MFASARLKRAEEHFERRLTEGPSVRTRKGQAGDDLPRCGMEDVAWLTTFPAEQRPHLAILGVIPGLVPVSSAPCHDEGRWLTPAERWVI